MKSLLARRQQVFRFRLIPGSAQEDRVKRGAWSELTHWILIEENDEAADEEISHENGTRRTVVASHVSIIAINLSGCHQVPRGRSDQVIRVGSRLNSARMFDFVEPCE